MYISVACIKLMDATSAGVSSPVVNPRFIIALLTAVRARGISYTHGLFSARTGSPVVDKPSATAGAHSALLPSSADLASLRDSAQAVALSGPPADILLDALRFLRSRAEAEGLLPPSDRRLVGCICRGQTTTLPDYLRPTGRSRTPDSRCFFGLYTILQLSIWYGVYHTQEGSGGVSILRNSRAIVLQ